MSSNEENTRTPSTPSGGGGAPAPVASNVGYGNVHNITSIEKLDGISNYINWKFAVQMILTSERLWKCVTGGDTDADRDSIALARICLTLKPHLYQHVRGCTTSKQAWEKLQACFENKGLYRRVLLLRQLHRVEYHQYATMSEYINTVMCIVQQLEDIGKKIDDAEVAEILLSGLPQEYDIIVSSLETACLTTSLESEVVRMRLLQEDHRRKQEATSTAYAANYNKKKSGSVLCTYCRRQGHTAKRCYKRKREQRDHRDTGAHTMLASAFTATPTATTEFIVDSGASAHMVNDDKLVEDRRQNLCNISVANGQTITSNFIGKISISPTVCLSNVLVVPNLSNNLISVSQMTNEGYVVVFNNDGCNIFKKNGKTTGNPIISAKRINGLYKFSIQQGRSLPPEHSKLLHSRQETVRALKADYLPYSLWHKRLGHLHDAGLRMLGEGNQCCGVLLQKEDNPVSSCVSCLTGKMHKASFPVASSSRAASPLDLIHSDVAGPMQVSSWGGARYLLTFTDDCTRKTFGYLMKSKSEVSSHFLNFKNMVEKQTGLHIKILRTDNGTEYCNSAMRSILLKAGIVHQTSVVYCPEQNGIAERVQRTVFEKARAMLQESGLSNRYWGEAVMTAIYLKNRSPTAALSNRIPECIWTDAPVNLTHLRVFGCLAYSLVPQQKRQKLDAKAKPYIFVGYGETCKGYRLSDPSDPRVVIYSRDVTFIESEFYAKTLQAEKGTDDFIIFDRLNFNNSCNNGILNNQSNDNELNCDIILNNELNNDNNLNNINCDKNIPDSCDISSRSSHNLNNSKCSSSDKSNRSSSEISDADITPPPWSPLSDQYCTGEDRSDDGDEDPSLPVPETACRGGGGEPTVSAGSDATRLPRPVRSTRGKLPQKLSDYDLSTLMAEASSLDDPSTYEEAMSSSDKEEWCKAIKCEYDSLLKNNVWELVDRPKHTNVVKCKWVFKRKYDATGKFTKYKARLVARGFSQKEGIDYSETFSPVVRHSTLRILFSLATELNLQCNHIDVTTAFLNGELEETIFMEQPKGFNDNDKVCMLKKSIYGLKQASRMWNAKIHNVLCANGYKQSKCEPCIYVKKSDKDYVILALYVDDFYVFHNNCINDVVILLQKYFEIRHLGELKNCLGMNITRHNDCLILDQSDYVKRLLAKFNMTECKPVSTPLDVSTKLDKSDKCLDETVYRYRQLLGSLMYLSVCTRPDISYACSQLSQYSTCFDMDHWRAAKRVLRYLAGTLNYGLYFCKGGNLNICAYTDADWANNLYDRKSYTGFVIKMGGNVVNWEARKQRCISLSSTESEYLAIGDVCKDICFVRNFLSEIIDKNIEAVVYNDNQSAQKLLLIKEYSHKRTKHIDLRYHFVKDLIQQGLINVKYLPTEQMVADVLTKPLSKIKHENCISELCLKNV